MSGIIPNEKEHFLYLTTTGRKSGQPHTIEIWFVAHEGCYYLVSENREASHWVKNIQHNPSVAFYIGAGAAAPVSPHYTGTARTITPADEPLLVQLVSALMDAKYHWSDGLIVELKPE